MSRSKHQKCIPHRYRKGPDGGVRKSPYWKVRKHTKPEIKGVEDFEEGWLLRQLEACSKEVESWSDTKKAAMRIREYHEME